MAYRRLRNAILRQFWRYGFQFEFSPILAFYYFGAALGCLYQSRWDSMLIYEWLAGVVAVLVVAADRHLNKSSRN
jgi:hypothetical protein